MKLIVVLTLLGAAVVARAEDLKTRGGKEYKDIKVMAVEADGLKIMHAAGMAKIPYEQLPDDLQTKYAFDPTKAAEKRTADDAAKKMSAEQARAAAAKSAREKEENAKLEFRYMEIKVARVVEGGLIAYSHSGGGVAGSAARAMNAITGGGGSGVVPEETDYSRPLFIEGVKSAVAEGDVLRGYAARKGVKKYQGRSYQLWVSKPEGGTSKTK